MQPLLDISLLPSVDDEPSFDGFPARSRVIMTPWMLFRLRLYECQRGRRFVGDVRETYAPPLKDALDFSVSKIVWTDTDGITHTSTDRFSRDFGNIRVAFHQDGALGDELMYTSVVHALEHQCPGVAITNYATPPNHYVGYGIRAIGGRSRRVALGWTREQMDAYDAWILPRPVGYLTRGAATNVYDQITDETGIRPIVAVPYVNITGMDRDELAEVLHGARGIPLSMWDRMIVIQTNATQANRSPADIAGVLRSVVERFDKAAGWWYVVVGDAGICRAAILAAGLGSHPRLLMFGHANDREHLSARSIMQFIERARVVITPDSFSLHAAAGLGIPTVALWNMGNGGHCDTLPQDLPMSIQRARREWAANETPGVDLATIEAVESQLPSPESRIATYTNPITVVDMADDSGAIADAAWGLA